MLFVKFCGFTLIGVANKFITLFPIYSTFFCVCVWFKNKN